MSSPVTALDAPFVRDFCRKWQIAELRVFGSVLRDDFRPDSDIDVLVEFRPNVHWGLLELAAAEAELRERLGRSVDLVIKDRLKWVIRDRVLAASEVLYAG